MPPVLMPGRLEKLFDLGREPEHADVDLATEVGGFAAPLPVYVSALGSTRAAGTDLKLAIARQAGRLGIPMVIGENVIPIDGYRGGQEASRSLCRALDVYFGEAGEDRGAVVVQQSTEDADAEVWNLIYSDPAVAELVQLGRLGFELKVGQGAKPGLGGMAIVSDETMARLRGRYRGEKMAGLGPRRSLRMATPGTFTEEILRSQIRLMRSNFPHCRTWVKLPPGRDVAIAAAIVWEAGADAVVVDGAEGGTGLAPRAFLNHVGLPLGECLRRVRPAGNCLCASGRVWEGSRALKCLALGARSVGLGRAAVLAVDENPTEGLCNLVEALELELRLLVSALGKYSVAEVSSEDLWPLGNQSEGDQLDPADRTSSLEGHV
ncbi:MAG TPA: glutamate synthase-related protein [Solirubrobacterales bacterium]|nr:glutamate synthase-related protein [Solirubrobacterales bacterium]